MEAESAATIRFVHGYRRQLAAGGTIVSNRVLQAQTRSMQGAICNAGGNKDNVGAYVPHRAIISVRCARHRTAIFPNPLEIKKSSPG